MREYHRHLMFVLVLVSVCILTACDPMPPPAPTEPAATEVPPVIVLESTEYAEATSHWPEPAMANGVTIRIHDMVAYSESERSYSPVEGYVYLLLDVEVSNETAHLLHSSSHLRVVDDFNNTYANWGTIQYPSLPALEYMDPTTTERGWASFPIPLAALHNIPRLRFESADVNCRIEIFLSTDIPVNPYPIPEPTAENTESG